VASHCYPESEEALRREFQYPAEFLWAIKNGTKVCVQRLEAAAIAQPVVIDAASRIAGVDSGRAGACCDAWNKLTQIFGRDWFNVLA
jgi:hypothetical protein